MRLLDITVVLSAILVFGIGSIRAAEPQAGANGLAGGAQSITGKDGAPMMLIPAGAFTMGSNDGLPAERPEHTVTLDAYIIDRYEVSLQLYRKFLLEAKRDAPPTWDDEAAETVGDRPAVGMGWGDAAASASPGSRARRFAANWPAAS